MFRKMEGIKPIIKYECPSCGLKFTDREDECEKCGFDLVWELKNTSDKKGAGFKDDV